MENKTQSTDVTLMCVLIQEWWAVHQNDLIEIEESAWPSYNSKPAFVQIAENILESEK